LLETRARPHLLTFSMPHDVVQEHCRVLDCGIPWAVLRKHLKNNWTCGRSLMETIDLLASRPPERCATEPREYASSCSPRIARRGSPGKALERILASEVPSEGTSHYSVLRASLSEKEFWREEEGLPTDPLVPMGGERRQRTLRRPTSLRHTFPQRRSKESVGDAVRHRMDLQLLQEGVHMSWCSDVTLKYPSGMPSEKVFAKRTTPRTVPPKVVLEEVSVAYKQPRCDKFAGAIDFNGPVEELGFVEPAPVRIF